MDGLGRATKATITVFGPAGTLGFVSTVGGQFAMYDVAPGRYRVSVRSARDGSTSQAQISVGRSISTIVLRVQ